MTLTFSEALDAANFTPSQLVQRFAVGVGNNDAWPVESVSIAGSVVTLSIPSTQPIPSTASLGGGVVRVSYNDLGAGNDTANILQDAAGNDVASIPGTPVTNGSTFVPPATDTTAPTLQSAFVSTDGRTITLTFSEALDIAAPTLSQMPARFTVTAGLASNWPIESVSISGNVVVLTTPDYAPIPRPANLNPSTVTVGYTDVTPGNDATEVLQDYPAGNDVATFSGFAAQNNSTYTPGGPTLPNVQTVDGAFTVTEGQGNTYMVTLDAPAPAGGMTLAWRVTPATTGASASPEDFQAVLSGQMPSGELYFGPGATQASVTLSIFDDTAEEPAEGFFFKVGKVDAAQVFQPIAGAEVYTVIYESDQGGDKQAPDLSIGASTQKILAGDYVSVYFSFTEPVTGFDLSDVTVTGGTLSNLYKSPSGDFYNAQFLPTSFDGTSTFSVAAGRYADAAGNLNTLASTLSVPTFTVQPGNSGSTTLNGNQVIISFSEVITPTTPSGDPLSSSGFYLALNPTADNSFEGGSQPPQITGVALDVTGKVLTLTTNTVFQPSDVVRVEIDSWGAQFQDADGNRLARQEIYIGGSGNNTIDLDWYGPSARQILRGNGGNDELIGTRNADSLIDGDGNDTLDGVYGADSITLVENGGSIGYARDTVLIVLGDSRRGVGNTDFIGFDPANSGSGFDWFSTTASTHDVLRLESGVIGGASSFVQAPAAQGALASHSIVAGIVTFRNSAGGDVAITQATNLGNALDYLRTNLQAPGHTVAFKADYDNNGSAESLFVYQDMGTLPLAGNVELPDIVVRIAQPVADRLAAVTLGNAPGTNVLEIGDGASPDPLAVSLASNGVALNFTEPVFAPSTVGNLAMTLQVNGAGTVYRPASVTGAGTAVITVQAAGLALSSTDWALVSYGGTDASNALRDSAGNPLRAEDDNGNAVTHSFILGSSGNNNINLSAFPVNGWGMDIEALGGNDTVIGTALEDWIDAGTGADAITGGGGGDAFYFEQGDSPVAAIDRSAVGPNSYMLEGARYTFSGGVEVVTDLAAGDQVIIAPLFEGLINGSGWLMGVSASQTSETGSMTGAGATGEVPDQRFMGLQGTLGADGVFTVGSYDNSPDTLVLYDGDNAIGTALTTGFVLKGVRLNDLEGLYGGNSLRLRAPYPINGTSGNDTLNGTESADIINGLAGDDQLEGRGGNDSLSGGDGYDYLIGGSGNDTLDGGAQGSFGSDIAGYWLGGYTSPVNFMSTWRTSGGQQADGTGGTDTLTNIEELHFGGGSSNDVLVGDSGRNYIQGEGGDDSITGGGGNDTFAYSFGQYHGLQGNDTVTDFSGDDQLWFNNFSITSVTVGAPTGMLMMGGVSVVVDTDRTVLHVGADTVPGADLTITLLGGFQASGFRSNQFTFGGVTNSEIRYAVAQPYTGTAGDDSYIGGEADDLAEGRDGNDSLTGLGGDDVLKGEAGDDQLRGDDGNDTLDGGDGNDYLTGGLGNDSLVGGGGTGDTADYYYLGNPTGSLGPVTVNLSNGVATGAQGNDTLSGIENVNGSDGNDSITGDGNANFLDGRGGNDTLRGEAGDDSLRGGAGADSVIGGGGTDRIQYLTPVEMQGDQVSGSGVLWDGLASSVASGADQTTDDRVQLLGAGVYDFSVASFSFIDRIDVISNVPNATKGDFTLILSPQMASTANQNRNEFFSDIRVVGYDNAVNANGLRIPTTSNILVDASAFGTQSVVVMGQDGSGLSDPLVAFGGMHGNDTLIGGGGGDYLVGGAGDDVIRPGKNAGGQQVDTVITGSGNDTIDYRGTNQGNHRIDYSVLPASQPISVTIDTSAASGGTGSVVKGTIGIDTILGVGEVIDIPIAIGWAYFDIHGTSGHDSFSLTLGSNDWISLRGLGGNDVFSISGPGWVRLDYATASSGIDVNLVSLQVSDGMGGTDQVALSGGAVVKEVQGSAQSDKFLGSAAYESFIPGGGNDTVDGGGGGDRIRYDLGSVTDLKVDLSTGRAVGKFSGAGFEHQLSNLFVVRGSANGDELVAGPGAVRFEAGGGNDSVTGGAAADDLRGQDGNDTLQGRDGDDSLDGGNGQDVARFTGNFSQYTIVAYPDGSFAVVDTVSARDGVDTLRSVERLEFADQMVDMPGVPVQTFFAVNPAGTWLADLTSTAVVDAAPAPTSVPLTQIQASAGDILTLSRRGDFQYGAADGGFTDTVSNLLAVFVDGNGTPLYPGSFWGYRTSIQNSGRDTDIPQDFFVTSGITRASVPEGAVALRFSVNDRFFSDNLDPDNDFGVEITKFTGSEDRSREDALFGTSSSDTLIGGAGADTLVGGAGEDSLQGDDGDDFLMGNVGNDALTGGAGFDTANYSGASSAVQVDLVAGSAQGGDGTDTLVGIELVFGSSYDDLLKGGHPTNGSGTTDGFEGFRGNAGNDTIDGGAGFDRAQYDNSPYAVQVTLGGSSPGSARDGWRSNTSDPASDGTDTLINIEEVRGSAYNDTLTGSEEAGRYESFEGRAGNDTISGRAGTDRASYQTSPNAVNVNLGLGTARDGWRSNSSDAATDGTDTLTGIEEVRGSDFNDTIVGSDGNNFLDGRSGNDAIAGGAGTDTLFGEAGSDTLDGGDGEDYVTYRSSTAGIVVDLAKATGQVQDGLGGVDTVISIEGFIGGPLGDQFLGPVVAMPYLYIEGAGGADTIDGGTAAGVREVGFTFDVAGVTARLSGWVGATGALQAGYTGSALDGSGAIDVFRNIRNLEGSNFNDALYGDANDNNIDGRGGADTIDGGEGRDTIEFNQATAGIHVDLSQNRVLDDGQGVGSAAAGAAVEQDTLVSIENVDGGGFNDLIVGSGVENFLQGRGGVDTLNGGGGDDTLQGGSGDDTLDGGAGVDTAGFSGAFADYTVLIEATGIRITDKVANRDGTDQLVNVERFLFSDGEYKLSGSGVGLAALNPQAAEVLDRTQGSGYTDAVDASTFQFTDSNIGDWIDGFPPLLISQVTTRTSATIVGDGDDNELKYGTEFIAGAAGTPGTTQVFFRYDTNAAVGQVQSSDLIELSFPGDVRASLVPESLTYSG